MIILICAGDLNSLTATSHFSLFLSGEGVAAVSQHPLSQPRVFLVGRVGGLGLALHARSSLSIVRSQNTLPSSWSHSIVDDARIAL